MDTQEQPLKISVKCKFMYYIYHILIVYNCYMVSIWVYILYYPNYKIYLCNTPEDQGVALMRFFVGGGISFF